MIGSNLAKEIDEEYKQRKFWQRIKKEKERKQSEEKKGEKKAL